MQSRLYMPMELRACKKLNHELAIEDTTMLTKQFRLNQDTFGKTLENTILLIPKKDGSMRKAINHILQQVY